MNPLPFYDVYTFPLVLAHYPPPPDGQPIHPRPHAYASALPSLLSVITFHNHVPFLSRSVSSPILPPPANLCADVFVCVGGCVCAWSCWQRRGVPVSGARPSLSHPGHSIPLEEAAGVLVGHGLHGRARTTPGASPMQTTPFVSVLFSRSPSLPSSPPTAAPPPHPVACTAPCTLCLRTCCAPFWL
jgi:hypothetical protein